MKSAWTGLLSMLLTSFVFAHDFFLYPSSFRVKEKEKVKISIHVDDLFPGQAVKWNAQRVLRFEQWFGSISNDIREKNPEQDSSGVLVTVEGSGLNMFALD